MNSSTDSQIERACPSDVVALCQALLRIDTTNTGERATTVGEREAADYVATVLSDAGLSPELYSSEPGRTSVIARFPGVDRTRPALLLHGHLDVVPAEAGDWRFDPFGGVLSDGYLWGRGAVDMKHFVAMLLAIVRRWRREGSVPPRDLVLAFLADEEAGGALGSRFLADQHPEVFAGCSEAVGEVGGFSCQIDAGRRMYLIETGEKGMHWLRLRAHGRAGHGSMVHPDNVVTALADAVTRLGRHRFPVTITPTVRAMLQRVAAMLDLDIDPDSPADAERAIARLGPVAKIIGATVRNTANPTRFTAGYKDNVIPGHAVATIDCRTLPGQDAAFADHLRAIVGPGIDLEYLERQPGFESTFDGPLVDAMTQALDAEDPGVPAVPYLLSAGTDAKAFTGLGMRCFGFAPLRLPADLDFAGLFHGVDERVPVDGLEFGVRVLDRFLRAC